MLFLRAVFSCSAAASLSGRAAHVDEFSALVLSLAMLVTAAKLGGDLAGRFGQLAVLGELAAGMLLGNLPGLGPLQYLAADTYLDTFARLGMLLLLFEVGLELSVRELFAVGPSSLLVALFGTTASFAIGWGVAAQFLPSAPRTVHVFLAAAITATSVGITVRVLKDLRASRSGEAKIILGAAVVDDIIALVVLGLVTGGLAAGPATSASEWRAAMGLVAKTIGFLTLAIVLGVKLTPRWFRHAANLRAPGALLALGLCFCFFLSWAASAIGLAGLVGAFAAGLVLEDTHSEAFVQRGERSLGELLEPMTSFLVPIFFVLVGFRTNVRVLADPAVLGLPLALTLAAVLGKLTCAWAPGTHGDEAVQPIELRTSGDRRRHASDVRQDDERADGRRTPRNRAGQLAFRFDLLNRTLEGVRSPLVRFRGYPERVFSATPHSHFVCGASFRELRGAPR